MFDPPQRGALAGNRVIKVPPFDKNAPFDHKSHFPAGDKSTVRGSGKSYQQKAAGYKYTTFTPMKPGFNWRAGVCGDVKSGPGAGAHLKGGKYYYDGTIVKSVRKESSLEIEVAILVHHKGFMEFHVCDVDKKYCSSGDLTPGCFKEKNCRQLERAPNKECDSGKSIKCGPIDRNYPGRWYLPCEQSKAPSVYGKQGEIKYKMPKGFTCKHCVLHWYWVAANDCHVEGVTEYFAGPDRPKMWDSCGRRGAKQGGYYVDREKCGGNKFPEEYYQCADMEIR